MHTRASVVLRRLSVEALYNEKLRTIFFFSGSSFLELDALSPFIIEDVVCALTKTSRRDSTSNASVRAVVQCS